MAKNDPWDKAWTTEPKHNYEAMRARQRAYDAVRYARALVEHLCCSCLKPLPEDYDRRRCAPCLSKRNDTERINRPSARRAQRKNRT